METLVYNILIPIDTYINKEYIIFSFLKSVNSNKASLKLLLTILLVIHYNYYFLFFKLY